MTKEKEQKTELVTAEQRAEQIRKQRKGRRPMDGLVTRFPVLPPRQGFKTHWFNDDKGKIERAKENGWEFSKRAGFTDGTIDLEKNPNQRIRVMVDHKADGSDMHAYAMDIPEDIYNDDRAAKARPTKERLDFISKGGTDSSDATLAKDTGMKVETTIQTNFKPD